MEKLQLQSIIFHKDLASHCITLDLKYFLFWLSREKRKIANVEVLFRVERKNCKYIKVAEVKLYLLSGINIFK